MTAPRGILSPLSSGSGATVFTKKERQELRLILEGIRIRAGQPVKKRAGYTYTMEYEEEEMSFAVGDQAGPGLQSTPKIPPSFDGRSSWFAYEEAVDDWVDITTLDADKQGPSLKNRLVGDASVLSHFLTETF